MKYDKVQKSILGEMLKNPLKVKRIPFSADKVFILVEACIGFVIPRSILLLDISNLTESYLPFDCHLIAGEDENKCSVTKNIIDTTGSSQGYLSVLRRGNEEIYVSTKALAMFGACAEYWSLGHGAPIIITERDEVVGCVAASALPSEEEI